MHIVIAPDKFAGTLSAPAAAQAIADGWHAADPAARTTLVPLSDGGPGFVDVLHTALGGRIVPVEVSGPLGERRRAEYLIDGTTAYIESAQACGLHLVPAERRDPARTTTHGVGTLIAHAAAEGARTVVVGLGGSSTNDGGAGMLAALGARPGAELSAGGGALAGLAAEGGAAVDVEPARHALAGVALVAATDVDNPLLGGSGASAVFGPQKGADPERVRALEAALAAFAAATDPREELSRTPGAGAAGGLGYGLLLLGGTVESGIARVLDAVGLDATAATADLVLTGEGSFDRQSLHGKLPHGVARTAARHGVPCVVLAGQVDVDRDEAAAAGITAAHSLVGSAGSVQAALARPAEELRALAEQVARHRRR